MPIRQSIRTRIWPIQGLDLSPQTPEGDIQLGEDVDVVLSLVAGRSPGGTSVLSLADDGSLRVSVQGASYSAYTFASGTAADDYNADNTVTYEAPQAHFSFLVTTHPAKVQMKGGQNIWGAEIPVAAGDALDYDFAMTGLRVKNGSPGQNAAWSLLTFS